MRGGSGIQSANDLNNTSAVSITFVVEPDQEEVEWRHLITSQVRIIGGAFKHFKSFGHFHILSKKQHIGLFTGQFCVGLLKGFEDSLLRLLRFPSAPSRRAPSAGPNKSSGTSPVGCARRGDPVDPTRNRSPDRSVLPLVI